MAVFKLKAAVFNLKADPSKVFSDIYREDRWKGGSGPGSKQEFTGPYIRYIQRFIRERGIRSVVDFGCGDWQFSREIDWSGVQYRGIDAVPDMIARNREKFQAPHITFEQGNETLLKHCRADLLLIKDVLQHWPNGRIRKFLGLLRNFRYALITNCAFEHPELNQEIKIGDFRPLDLRKPPFSIQAAEVLRFRTPEHPEGFLNKLVLLWKK